MVIFDLYPGTGERLYLVALPSRVPPLSNEVPPLTADTVAENLFARTLTGAAAAAIHLDHEQRGFRLLG